MVRWLGNLLLWLDCCLDGREHSASRRCRPRLPTRLSSSSDSVTSIAPLLRLSSIVFSIGAGWLIFMYLYTVLPETREPWSVVRRGALLGSIALVALQYLASFLISAFQGNPRRRSSGQ